MLQQTFTTLLKNYTNDVGLMNELWLEVEKNYTGKKRHYHTLEHLEHLLAQLTHIKGELKHWDTLLFTLFYHDIVYNALKSDNEEKSAVLAQKRMRQIGVEEGSIEQCKKQILATKTHIKAPESDTNYFTDADLSVLGQSWEIYSEYYKNVRKEYSIYPDFMYNSGRKKVLFHFLSMEAIFKTDYFYAHFEEQARENLQKEFELL